MPSKKQVATLKAIGRNRENIHVAAGMLGVNDRIMNKRMTSLFQEFNEGLDLMIEYFPVFKRRWDAHEEESYKKVRRLSRLIGGEVKSITRAVRVGEEEDS